MNNISSISDAEYEEDDLLSFANSNYMVPMKDSLKNSGAPEYEQQKSPLLDHHQRELSLSPDAAYFFDEKDHRKSGNESEDEQAEIENESDDEQEKIYRVIDDFYVMMDRNSFDKPMKDKKRHKYADIGFKDMGVSSSEVKDVDGLSNESEPSSPSIDSNRDENLPPGWEKHSDDHGSYYWHIKTGTIQRHPPEPVTSDSEHSVFEFPESPPLSKEYSNSTSNFPNSKLEPKRYSVRSLGWREIDPENLTPEKSSRAVNRCILDLSAGKNDSLDAVGRWGDGKDIFLELYADKICLVDSVDSIILHSQPIETVRVWGVGRDDSRDFAIVARDQKSCTFRCHVLRCDMPARRIAHALKEICQEYILQHGSNTNGKRTPKRPHTLSLGRRRNSLLSAGNSLLPTPTEEPKKIFRVQYIGRRAVKNGVGIETMHNVINQLVAECSEDQWIPVSLAVSPSTITIMTQEQEPEVIAECRVRYLTFVGIGRDDVRTCGFIVHTPEDTFLAHVFHACDSSGGPLCKAVEAACKLRYQKFLDAHAKAIADAQKLQVTTPTERIGAKLKSFFGSMTNHLRPS